jgi:hypothetical protein
MYPVTESGRQDPGSNKYSESRKAEIHGMAGQKMLALYILIRLLLSAMWGGLTPLAMIAIKMGSIQGDRGRPAIQRKAEEPGRQASM